MNSSDRAHGMPDDLITEAASWRHHLHSHPELAYSERQTAEFIASKLGQFGLAVSRPLASTGVVGTLRRGTGRRAIAIRADIDGLPIHEQSGVQHTSRFPGIMHACGHDGHIAMALAAARICTNLPDLDGTVHFIFQPAEESGGGAQRMVEEGLFRIFPCDAVYAVHNWPTLPLGTYVALDGAMMAANAVFEIEVFGRSCHGAMPHVGADAVLASCHLVSALQSIVSRNIDPLQAAVVSTTQITAGDTHNVMPDSCVIRGTTRWFDNGVGDCLERRLVELSRSIVAGFGCEAQVRYERRYPATINDPASASLIRGVGSASPLHLSSVDAAPSMASEDFSYMLQAVPGCYIWLGAGRTDHNHGLHSSHYDFNDELLPIGVALWVSLVRKSLSGP